MGGIRDLAKHLNLSIGTVSRALNGRPDVNAETRARVLKAAAELSYSPNQSGRSLRRGRTGMVAMIVPTSRRTSVADTIFMPIVDGLRMYLAERGLDLMVLLCGPEEDPYPHLRRVAERRLADGLIIADTQRIDRRIEYLLDAQIPFVAFGRSSSGGAHPWIDLDFEGVADFAIDRLARNGHRRIALATIAGEINFGGLFADAYRAAVRARGIEVDPDLIVKVENSEHGGYQLGERVLDMADRPTAALLANELMVIGLYERLGEAGLAPGRDLAVIGFGEEPSARFLRPKVTCFSFDLRGLGAALGAALMASMPEDADEPPQIVQKIWPMTFRPGESDGGTIG
jgi:DNA-binding LacI/PurR family transcriptional regulator